MMRIAEETGYNIVTEPLHTRDGIQYQTHFGGWDKTSTYRVFCVKPDGSKVHIKDIKADISKGLLFFETPQSLTDFYVLEIQKKPFCSDLSIVLPVRSYKQFEFTFRKFVEQYSAILAVEFLIKADKDADELATLCEQSPFQYKILTHPRYGGRRINHLVQNDLANLASGNFIWFIGDDAEPVGDYCKAISKVAMEESDRIYCIQVPFFVESKMRTDFSSYPIITKEWKDVFGGACPCNAIDRWCWEMARALQRSLYIPPEAFYMKKPRRGRAGITEQERIFFKQEQDRILLHVKKRLFNSDRV